jgi:anti-sigma factor RsiW
LLPYIDGRLTGHQAVELKAHLDECADCAALLAGLRSTAQVLDQVVGGTTAPFALTERCLAALQREAAAIPAARAHRAELRWRPLRALALAAASLALAITGLSLIAPPAYAMVVSNVARLSAQASMLAVERVPAWGQVLRAIDGLLAIIGL